MKWRCFHCNVVFTRRREAAEHFGAHQDDTPACCLRDHEHHLVHYIRRLEAELAEYRAEDSDVMRSIMTLEADHRQALIRAEEAGYNRGVRDVTAENIHRGDFEPFIPADTDVDDVKVMP